MYRSALAFLLAISLSALAGPAAAIVIGNEDNFTPEPLPEKVQVDANGVDSATGGLSLSATDVVIGTPGAGGLAYERVYAGGWRWAGFGSISSSGSSFSVSIGNSSEKFTLSGSTFTADEPSGATLTRDAATYTYTGADGSVLIFDRALKDIVRTSVNEAVLISATTPNGAITTYHYKSKTVGAETRARLQSVTNTYGYQLHFTHADDNPATTTALANDWLRVTKVTGVNNAVDYCAPTADTCSGFTVTWPQATYAGPHAQMTSVTDALGRVTTYTYSGNKLASIKWPGSASNNVVVFYNSTTGLVSAVSRGFGSWGYNYADSGSDRTTTITNPAGGVDTVKSNLTTGLVTSYKNAVNQTTSYLYDVNKRLTRITFPEGNYVQYAYDARGNVTETRRVAKAGSGLADLVATAAYPATCSNPKTCNKPTSTTDVRGKTTDYTYNSSHGGVLTVTAPDPDGAGSLVRPQVRYAYAQKQARYKNGASSFVNGPAIWVLTETSACATTASCAGGADETKTTVAFPGAGSANNLLPLSVTTAAGNGAVSSAVAFTYDAIGDVLTVDGPLAGTADTTRFRYDAARQLVGVVGPDPDGAGALKYRAARTTYNSYGLPTIGEQGTVNSQSDADWAAFATLQKTETVYDVHGRAIEARLFDGLTRLAVSQQSYDSAGRPECAALRMNSSVFASLPASACTASASGAFGGDRISKTAYDAAGRPVSTLAALGTALEQTAAATAYTANGRVATLTDARGAMTTYEYDGHDRPKKTRLPHPTTANASSTTDYEELTWGTGTTAGLVTAQRLRDGTSVALAYDSLARVTLANAPGTTPDVATAYDNFGRVTSLSQTGHTLTYVYDQLSRLLSEAQPNGTVSWQYDAAGRRTKLTYPGAFFVDYDWNDAGDLLKIRENGAVSGVGVLATFAHDDLGRRVSLTRGNGGVTSYGFDAASRLSSLTQDAAGTADDLTNGFAYNPASQIASETASTAAYDWTHPTNFTDAYASDLLNKYVTAAGATISHDARGNLTFDGTKTFAYDAANRLTSASGGGVSATLKYDPAGRLYEVAGTSATRFLYDGADLIAEYDGAGTLLRRHVHGPGADEPLVWYEGAGTADRRFLMADPRGSIIAVADSAGTVTAKNKYDAYGAPAAGNQGRFQYTGQIWLAEAGLYHYKARAYHPGLGRFMQTDPIGYSDGLNIYAYAGNDPVNGTDPSGLVQCTGSRLDLSAGTDCSSRAPSNCFGNCSEFFGGGSLGGGGTGAGSGGGIGSVSGNVSTRSANDNTGNQGYCDNSSPGGGCVVFAQDAHNSRILPPSKPFVEFFSISPGGIVCLKALCEIGNGFSLDTFATSLIVDIEITNVQIDIVPAPGSGIKGSISVSTEFLISGQVFSLDIKSNRVVGGPHTNIKESFSTAFGERRLVASLYIGQSTTGFNRFVFRLFATPNTNPQSKFDLGIPSTGSVY